MALKFIVFLEKNFFGFWYFKVGHVMHKDLRSQKCNIFEGVIYTKSKTAFGFLGLQEVPQHGCSIAHD